MTIARAINNAPSHDRAQNTGDHRNRRTPEKPHVLRPTALTRTYLLLASKNTQILAWLAKPGTNLWLIPKHIASRERAKEGAATGDDLYGHALPIGTVTEPSAAIKTALNHVGHHDS